MSFSEPHNFFYTLRTKRNDAPILLWVSAHCRARLRSCAAWAVCVITVIRSDWDSLRACSWGLELQADELAPSTAASSIKLCVHGERTHAMQTFQNGSDTKSHLQPFRSKRLALCNQTPWAHSSRNHPTLAVGSAGLRPSKSSTFQQMVFICSISQTFVLCADKFSVYKNPQNILEPGWSWCLWSRLCFNLVLSVAFICNTLWLGMFTTHKITP